MLFVPGMAPFDQDRSVGKSRNIRLYVKRVFISGEQKAAACCFHVLSSLRRKEEGGCRCFRPELEVFGAKVRARHCQAATSRQWQLWEGPIVRRQPSSSWQRRRLRRCLHARCHVA
jgi:hypothetical protein